MPHYSRHLDVHPELELGELLPDNQLAPAPSDKLLAVTSPPWHEDCNILLLERQVKRHATFFYIFAIHDLDVGCGISN